MDIETRMHDGFQRISRADVNMVLLAEDYLSPEHFAITIFVSDGEDRAMLKLSMEELRHIYHDVETFAPTMDVGGDVVASGAASSTEQRLIQETEV